MPVCELGAGSGHLALALAAHGLPVTAVEPARLMLEVLSQEAAARGLSVAARHAAAEDTGLPPATFGLVVLADAAHWVHATRTGQEVRRLLAPGGGLAVVQLEPLPSPFMTALEHLFAAYNPKAARQPPPLDELVRLATGRKATTVEVFDERLPLDAARLDGILRTLSFLRPALGEARFATLRDEARALLAAHPGATWERRVTLRWARKTIRPDRRRED